MKLRTTPLRTLAGATVLWFSATAAAAQQTVPDLATASLDDLMRITITSASRREQSAFDVAGAVYVITQDDIRRSGLTSVPELLRLAPGVQVARIDSNKWAIAIRGFNSRWSNKLLVLIDGRTVYTRLLSGVFWDMVQMPVETIDQIEVIRGPGGSVWGANAVGGVINILTKPGSHTRDGSFRAATSALGGAEATAAYGGSIGAADVRVYGQWFDHGYSLLPDSRKPAGDDSRGITSGFRADWTGVSNTVLFQGGLTKGHSGGRRAVIEGPIPPLSGWQNASWTDDWLTGNVLARWTHTINSTSSVQTQVFVDQLHRFAPQSFDYRARTFDIDVTYRTKRGRHAFVAGAASRYVDDRILGSFSFVMTPARVDLVTSNAFVQDEVSLAGDRLRMTFGSKLEHDTFGGWGLQPTFRTLWRIDGRQRAWVAVSRALRTPARVDRGMHAVVASFMGPQGLPVLVAFDGSPSSETEELRGLEAGYRVELGAGLSLDLAAFANRYSGLKSVESDAPVLAIDAGRPYLVLTQTFGRTGIQTTTHGGELSAVWQPAPWWQLHGAVSTLRFTPLPGAAAADSSLDGAAPRYQWHVRTSVAAGPRLDLAGALFGVGPIATRQTPGYQRADLHITWKATPRLSISAAGQDLVGRGHLEFDGPDSLTTPTLSSRRWTAELAWRFRP